MRITLNKLSQFSIILVGFISLYFILNTLEAFLRPLSIALLLTFLTINFYRSDFKKKVIKSSNVISGLFLIVFLIYIFLIAQNTTFEEEVSLENSLNSTLSQNESSTISTSNPFSNFNFIKDIENDYKYVSDYSFISTQDLDDITQEAVTTIFSSLSVLISELFLVIIFYIFIIPSYDTALNYLQKTYFKENADDFKSAIFEIEHGIKSYLYIKILVSLGTGISSGIVIALYGVNNVLLLSFMISALNFIPNIGSIIAVFIVVSLYTIQVGIGIPVIMLLIILGAIQLLFGNYIEPKISGRGLNMPPILILLSLFFWGTLWGVGGMLISVPLTHSIKIIVEKLSVINK